MTEFHKIPPVVSAAADSDRDPDLMSEVVWKEDDPERKPERALRDAKSELRSVFATLNGLSAVGEECIVLDADQLSATELFELCRSIEGSRAIVADEQVQRGASDELATTVDHCVTLAERQVTLYANLLEIPTRIRPHISLSMPGNRYGGFRVPRDRFTTMVEAAARSLEAVEEFEASDASIPGWIDVDGIVAESTVLADLDIEKERSHGKVEVSSETHHFGIRSTAIVSNHRTCLLYRLLNVVDSHTDRGRYVQPDASRPLRTEQFERCCADIRALPQTVSRVTAALLDR